MDDSEKPEQLSTALVWRILVRSKADNSHLLILSVSRQKGVVVVVGGVGLLSFKCKWEYGPNPQRDGLKNGSWTPSRLWRVFIFKRGFERGARCSYRPKHLKRKLCLVCSDQSWERARYLGAKGRRKNKARERNNSESCCCRLSYGLSFSLTKKQMVLNSVSVLALQMLTSHKAIKEELMRPKQDLFWVLMSCTLHAGLQKVKAEINIISPSLDRSLKRTSTLLSKARDRESMTYIYAQTLSSPLKPATPFGLSLTRILGCAYK